MKRIIFLLLGACLCACGRYGCGVPAGYEPLLDAALAGCPRADSLRNLLRQTPREQREGMAFLIAHMPRGDRDTMRLDLLPRMWNMPTVPAGTTLGHVRCPIPSS